MPTAEPPRAPGVTALPPRADGLTGFDVQFASGAQTRCLSGAGALQHLPALAAEAGLTGNSGFLCDAQLVFLQRRLVDSLGRALGGTLARAVREDRKQLAEVEAMTEVLSQRGLDRSGFVVALGGGVLTDLAGLAAALYLRGVPWISLPTTLLSQVDAGLGGKTGANLRSGKNLVGAFHQPRLVVCDPDVLATLPVRERWSGLAEIVKCALLDPTRDCGGEPFLERCERTLEAAAAGDAAALAPLIAASIRIKAEIVAVDEREGEAKKVAVPTISEAPAPMLRAYLNLGHTVGHAIEASSGYGTFAHGEAVALGLRAMLALSKARGLLADADAARGTALVDRLQIAPLVQLSQDQRQAALGALARDKKVREGQVRFVLLAGLGAPRLVPVSPEEAAMALDAALARPRALSR